MLLIAIHPSDGNVKPGSPCGAFQEEQAMSRHRVSPTPFLSSSPPSTTQLHYTNSYTYSHPNLNFIQYTIQILIPHVMWSAPVVRDLKIDHTQCIYLPCMEPEARNSAVGWQSNTHTLFTFHIISVFCIIQVNFAVPCKCMCCTIGRACPRLLFTEGLSITKLAIPNVVLFALKTTEKTDHLMRISRLIYSQNIFGLLVHKIW